MVTDYQKQGTDFLTKHGIKFTATFASHTCPLWCDGKHIHGDRYLITLSRKNPNKRFSFSFWNSYNAARTGKTPTPYDVLSAITKDNPGTLEDFADEFGYDITERLTKVTYKAVYEQWGKVEQFFTEDEIKELWEIN